MGADWIDCRVRDDGVVAAGGVDGEVDGWSAVSPVFDVAGVVDGVGVDPVVGGGGGEGAGPGVGAGCGDPDLCGGPGGAVPVVVVVESADADEDGGDAGVVVGGGAGDGDGAFGLGADWIDCRVRDDGVGAGRWVVGAERNGPAECLGVGVFGDGVGGGHGARLGGRDQRRRCRDPPGSRADGFVEFLFVPGSGELRGAARLVGPVANDGGGLRKREGRSEVRCSLLGFTGGGPGEDRVGFFGAVEGEERDRSLGARVEIEDLRSAGVVGANDIPEDLCFE